MVAMSQTGGASGTSNSGSGGGGGRAHFRSQSGCCICGTKSSSSRFTASQRYAEHFGNCFGPDGAARAGDLCNACVLCVKRWLQRGKKPNCFVQVLDSKKGPGPKHMKEITKRARRREAKQAAALNSPSTNSDTVQSQSCTRSLQSGSNNSVYATAFGNSSEAAVNFTRLHNQSINQSTSVKNRSFHHQSSGSTLSSSSSSSHTSSVSSVKKSKVTCSTCSCYTTSCAKRDWMTDVDSLSHRSNINLRSVTGRTDSKQCLLNTFMAHSGATRTRAAAARQLEVATALAAAASAGSMVPNNKHNVLPNDAVSTNCLNFMDESVNTNITDPQFTVNPSSFSTPHNASGKSMQHYQRQRHSDRDVHCDNRISSGKYMKWSLSETSDYGSLLVTPPSCCSSISSSSSSSMTHRVKSNYVNCCPCLCYSCSPPSLCSCSSCCYATSHASCDCYTSQNQYSNGNTNSGSRNNDNINNNNNNHNATNPRTLDVADRQYSCKTRRSDSGDSATKFEFRHPQPLLQEIKECCLLNTTNSNNAETAAITSGNDGQVANTTPIATDNKNNGAGTSVNSITTSTANNSTSVGQPSANASPSGVTVTTRRYNRRVVLPPVRMTHNAEVNSLLREIMERNSQAINFDSREMHMAVQQELRLRSRTINANSASGSISGRASSISSTDGSVDAQCNSINSCLNRSDINPTSTSSDPMHNNYNNNTIGHPHSSKDTCLWTCPHHAHRHHQQHHCHHHHRQSTTTTTSAPSNRHQHAQTPAQHHQCVNTMQDYVQVKCCHGCVSHSNFKHESQPRARQPQ